MSGTPMPPYVSTLRPIEELVDPELREFRRVYDKMMAKLHAMTREEFIAYHVELGALNSDGTPRLPEGDPIGMLDDVSARSPNT
jgi:hypothetical protein